MNLGYSAMKVARGGGTSSEDPSVRKRNTTIDVIRGFAICVVLLGHAIQVNLTEGQTSFLWSFLILRFQMPLMFLISGYSAGFSYPSKGQNFKALSFLRKKAARILIPCLVWTVIHYMAVVFLPGDYRVFGVKSFLLEFFQSDFWFLRFLFFFFVILWICDIILHWIQKEENPLFAVMLPLFAAVPVYFMTKVPVLSDCVSVWYYLWFLCGFSMNVLFDARLTRIKGSKLICTVMGIGSFLAMAMCLAFNSKLKSINGGRVVAIVFTFSVILLIFIFDAMIPRRIYRFFETLGKCTLPIYAIHWCLLFSPLWRLNFYTGLFINRPLWLSALVTALVWLILCLVLIYFLRKSRISRILLLGEK